MQYLKAGAAALIAVMLAIPHATVAHIGDNNKSRRAIHSGACHNHGSGNASDDYGTPAHRYYHDSGGETFDKPGCKKDRRALYLLVGAAVVVVALRHLGEQSKTRYGLTYGLVGTDAESAGFGVEWRNPDNPRQRASLALEPDSLDPQASYLHPLTDSAEASLTLDAENIGGGLTFRW